MAQTWCSSWRYRKYTSVHNSRGHSSWDWEVVHTGLNIRAAWGKGERTPQAPIQAPVYRDFSKISSKSENTGLHYFKKNHTALKKLFPPFMVFLLVQESKERKKERKRKDIYCACICVTHCGRAEHFKRAQLPLVILGTLHFGC